MAKLGTIHIAGVWRKNVGQHCARCGYELHHGDDWDEQGFPDGEVIAYEGGRFIASAEALDPERDKTGETPCQQKAWQ